MDEMIQLAKAEKVVGLKQVVRAAHEGKVCVVFIARDAQVHLKERVVDAVGDKDIKVIYVETMKKLGDACGIDVGAACAGIIES